MINTAETQPPRRVARGLINAGVTVPPAKGAAVSAAPTERLSPGESVAGSYIVDSAMAKQGRQADVYRVKRDARSYVVKLYHGGWRPSEKMRSFLLNIRHPNIAGVLECGDFRGRWYEVYEYFPQGTLEEAGRLTPAQIEKQLVPGLNEGLHVLHENGIVHCDIKPGNLFLAEDREGRLRVVIGDCGISDFMNADGRLIDAVRGTPEYAPRVHAVMGSAVMSAAYDYGSFGLVLCRALLGRSLFAGLSPAEIASEWEHGLKLPGSISGRLGELIRGLLYADEAKRWGYDDVRKWCAYEFRPSGSRSIYDGQRQRTVRQRPLLYGRVGGEMLTVTTLHGLAQAIRTDWEQAKNVLKKRDLADFLRGIDPKLADQAQQLTQRIGTDALDGAVFRLLTLLDDDPMHIFYRGRSFGTLEEYLTALESGRDADAKHFLLTGQLVFFLQHNGYDQRLVGELDRLVRRAANGDLSGVMTVCLALRGRSSYRIGDTEVGSLAALVPVLAQCTVREVDGMLRDDRFIAWLNRLGYEYDTRKLKEVLN